MPPAPPRLLSLLKMENLRAITHGSADLVPALVQACTDQDPRIAAQLRGYSFVETSGEYDLYRRSPPGVPAARPPIARPGTLDVLQPGARGVRALVADRSFFVGSLLFALAMLAARRVQPSGVERLERPARAR